MEIREYDNLEQASHGAADQIVRITRAALSVRGCCTLVLTGGRTVRRTYELLGEPQRARQLDWHHCHFFWGDERWVPSDHPDSNFRLAHDALLSRVNIPADNIHSMPTGYPAPAIGAEQYEKELRQFFQSFANDNNTLPAAQQPLPVFDLVLLGMGADGHIASLFQESGLLNEKEKWVAAVPENLGSPPTARLTLTLPVINRADNIVFLISGKAKKSVLDDIMHKPELASCYPAAHVKPAGNIMWFVARED